MLGDAKSWARRQGAPVTVAVLGSLVGVSLLLWLMAGRGFEALMFQGLGRPWTVLTYPWAFIPTGLGLICLLLLCWFMLSVGGAIERDLGGRRYAAFLLAMAVIPALLLGVFGPLLGFVPPLAGPFLASGGVVVAWGTRNPNSPIHLYGIIPIAAKWIAWLTVLGTLLGYGFGNPLLGVLACAGYAAAYLFAANKIPGLAYGGGGYSFGGGSSRRKVHGTRAQAQYDESYYDEVLRREQERDERERLRKLFENSLKDEK